MRALVALLGVLAGCAGVATRPDALDRLAIREVLDRASDAINHHEWDRLETTFASRIVWERRSSDAWRLDGREAIRAFLTGNEEHIEVLLYAVSATSIELHDAGHATARSTMSEHIRVLETGATVHVVGTYTDELVREDGEWRIAHRTFVPRYEEDGPPPARLWSDGAPTRSALDGIVGSE
ncbi:nuclear transport factor 2 family protein [Sandaracinus amylolyticus]|uniref:SnoaL-like domain-containing protein n=1 Tax=Sandaracinus amylolyticus TaxID=927083 RepID=A0A0F6W1J0_9BACT|nr:nuclear transport factor 2 family protein [Sandaracinus amylolyticus]AKF04871.1 hypothetical protein DB32_002020 [Sandaracinus amylolyticus]